jgi:hypothetical protein
MKKLPPSCISRTSLSRLLSSVAFVLAAAPALAGEFAPEIDLSSLDGATGFKLTGEAASVA